MFLLLLFFINPDMGMFQILFLFGKKVFKTEEPRCRRGFAKLRFYSLALLVDTSEKKKNMNILSFCKCSKVQIEYFKSAHIFHKT